MTLTGAEEDAVSFLILDIDLCPCECLIPRPLKPVGAPSLYFYSTVVQRVISTTIKTFMSTVKGSDMVKLVNKAFQCRGTFNLDLRGVAHSIAVTGLANLLVDAEM